MATSQPRGAPMGHQALADVVVVEVATGIAGAYAGRLLSDLGAQVVRIEPPGGDPLRTEPPIVAGESAFFAWLNAGKRSVVLDLADPGLVSLAANADIVLHAMAGHAADAFESEIARIAPSAVILSSSPYGRRGPRAGWAATPLTEYATGGYHYFAGDPAREPLALPGYQVEYHAALHGAIAALAGLWHSRATGQGQRIEVSHQEAMLSDHAWLTTSWTHQGKVQSRTGSLFVPCADGFVYLFNLAPYPNLFVLMERFDLLEDESLQDPLVWRARFPEIRAVFAEWAGTRTKQEIYHACQELRIAASPVNTMADVAASAQLAAREWFGRVTVGGQSLQAPGLPYRLTGSPAQMRTSAPTAGAHTGEVLAPAFDWANAAVTRPAAAIHAGRSGPLAGVRVIEVTANWAGPIAGRHLADLGADVIKVELATKPATRTLAWVADDLWPDHWNRSAYFNKLNRNKRAICLDLSRPPGKEAFLGLVRRADVVIENNAARVMGNLGLDYAHLSDVNPGIVMCSMAGYGATGPERNYSAYGSNIETVSGLASLLGYGAGEYFGTGSFYADPVTGNHGTVAILAALHARRETGKGQWIDISLLEAVLPLFAQQFLEFSATGQAIEPNANRSSRFVPHDVYPTAGRDCWLAIACRDDRDWAGIAEVIGRPDLVPLSGHAARRASALVVDGAIRAWASAIDHNDAAAALQARGVPAAPVMANWEIVSDNHLNDRGFFIPVRHERAGTFPYAGFPWRFATTPASIRLAAPLFAEHKDEVFGDLLGMDEAAIAALYREGVTADAPEFAAGSL